jgi:RNA polymerase sigma factor (sigma-70 family)
VSQATLKHSAGKAFGVRPQSAAETRYADLFERLRGPSKGMVRRAFGKAFSDDELDDIYSSAWLSTLGAFERKPRDLSEDELRNYLMTAVANHASREMRRRGRKPTVSLDDFAQSTADSPLPEEAAAHAEQAGIARDVIGSLPPRRRTVLMYRYGWGLEPNEICDLVEGLSPRAYRKEIERGVAEVAKKMRLVDEGGWCESREPLLRAVVAGVADDEERQQARRHLANCRSCTAFVGRLNGQLHELGGAIAFASLAEGAGVDAGAFADRGIAVVDRMKAWIGSAVGRGSESAEHAAAHVAASGGTRGAGVAGAGALAKLAGLGTVSKIVAACVGTGAAATACVAAGVLPGVERDRSPSPPAREVRDAGTGARETIRHVALTALDETETPSPDPPPSQPDAPQPHPAQVPAPAPAPGAAPAPAPTPPEPAPVETTPPPAVQDFEQVGTPVGQASPTGSGASSGGGTSGGGTSGGGTSGGGGDFGP